MNSASDLGSLDFQPDRKTVRIREVAEQLGVSDSLVENWIDTGALVALDVSTGGARAARKSRRIVVESYRAFVRKRMQA